MLSQSSVYRRAVFKNFNAASEITPDIPGFKALEGTETPPLQAHCLYKYSAEKGVFFYASSSSAFFFFQICK